MHGKYHHFMIEPETQTELIQNLPIRGEIVDRSRHTSMMCTIGNSSRSVEVLEKMIMAGMNIARLNLAYETHEEHAETIANLRTAVENCSEKLKYSIQIGIAIDLLGTKVRTGRMKHDEEFELKDNDHITLSVDKRFRNIGNNERIFIDFRKIMLSAEVGNRMTMNDDIISLIIEKVGEDYLYCRIEYGGILKSNSDVRLLGIWHNLPTLTKKDKDDIQFGLKYNVDFFFVPLVRSTQDIQNVRDLIGTENEFCKVIAKIETMQALEDINEIIKTSDGIVIARADLAIDLPMGKVVVAQKKLIALCNVSRKPSIVGTDVLYSMRFHPVPTVTELADVGRIVLDGADCIMLSAETAIGDYPVEATSTLQKLIKETEFSVYNLHHVNEVFHGVDTRIDVMAICAVKASRRILAAAIVVITNSGYTPALIAKYRPACPILGVAHNGLSAKYMLLFRGVVAMHYTENAIQDDWPEDMDKRVRYALGVFRKMGPYIKHGDPVVVVSPWKGEPGISNNLRIVIAELNGDSVDFHIRN